ncbi:polysaccharide lyase family 8 super-sandwich domain-containing protein [Kribbella solani]|uniref:polysaccharide lyase family 8 super-sandwich domain-containing protein n=1 Tax=Kribbella solani TaxID=236067 RepID=UPI0029AEA7F4|nr:polysaccharide lyase family 8 super-sandwich domain-containing protein [Kribbella solani]MDX2968195.1 polysaccharide lyase family 8 super-sandwich domain-containing protein [Kribbella solani]
MDVTRRRLLSFVPATALLTAVRPAPAAQAAVPHRLMTDNPSQLLGNAIAIYAGTPESNARPEVAAKVAAIDSTARTWLAALDRAGAGELFAGLPLGTSDPNLSASYQHLYEIALAYRRPGPASDLQGNVQVRSRIADKLIWLHDNYYGDQSKGYYGNWFTWEIGISTYVSKTLALIDAPPDLITRYVTSMDAYLRNGKHGDVDLDSRFHTGANLVDITANRVLQGALLNDDARLRKALQDQFTVFATVDPYNLQHGVTDGYYADGSFVQHASVAYTGSYGKALLSRVVQTIKVLAGTEYAQSDDLVGVVQGWVEHGFAPLIFEGWMMEIVKGRAVSRTATGYDDVAVVVEAIVDLADYATGADAARLKAFAKFTARPTINVNGFASPVSIGRFADLKADASIVPADLNPAASTTAFNAMDRTVHRRPGYAFALARNSERISKYEYMSGENLMPWFQGDGAHYLYLSGEDQTRSFGVDYFTSVSPYALGGVTAPVEPRKTIPELYGKQYYDNPALDFTPSSESQNAYVYFPTGTNVHSGGATMEAYGAVGWVQSDDFAYASRAELPDDFVVYKNAAATKSWFLLDDEIVVLAAGVGDADRAVTTTLDTRIAAAGDAVSVTGMRRNGGSWSGAGAVDPRWLRYTNGTAAIGYHFLQPAALTVDLQTVTRSRRLIRATNPDTAVTKQVFGLTFTQPAGTIRSLAYTLVPNATESAMRSYAHGRIVLLANTVGTQAIQHLGLRLTAVNTFTRGAHNLPGLSIDGPASLLLRRRTGGAVSVAVSDPTTKRDSVTVNLWAQYLRAAAPVPGVQVTRTLTGTRLTFTTRHTYGKSLAIKLLPAW